jgi:hypothetical protein
VWDAVAMMGAEMTAVLVSGRLIVVTRSPLLFFTT